MYPTLQLLVFSCIVLRLPDGHTVNQYLNPTDIFSPNGVLLSSKAGLIVGSFEHSVKPCEPLSAFRFFCFLVPPRGTEKPPQVQSSVVYSPRHANTSSHSHPQKQSLGLRHNKALACIPPARSWLLLRVMASRAREGCQPVRQTVLFLILLQKMGPLGTFLVASRKKHRPHHSIHLYTPFTPPTKTKP